jgi:hypothetical protein
MASLGWAGACPNGLRDQGVSLVSSVESSEADVPPQPRCGIGPPTQGDHDEILQRPTSILLRRRSACQNHFAVYPRRRRQHCLEAAGWLGRLRWRGWSLRKSRACGPNSVGTRVDPTLNPFEKPPWLSQRDKSLSLHLATRRGGRSQTKRERTDSVVARWGIGQDGSCGPAYVVRTLLRWRSKLAKKRNEGLTRAST